MLSPRPFPLLTSIAHRPQHVNNDGFLQLYVLSKFTVLPFSRDHTPVFRELANGKCLFPPPWIETRSRLSLIPQLSTP